MTFESQVDKYVIQEHASSLLTEFGRNWNETQIAELVANVSSATFYAYDASPLSKKLDDEIWFAMRTLERKWAN